MWKSKGTQAKEIVFYKGIFRLYNVQLPVNMFHQGPQKFSVHSQSKVLNSFQV